MPRTPGNIRLEIPLDTNPNNPTPPTVPPSSFQIPHPYTNPNPKVPYTFPQNPTIRACNGEKFLINSFCKTNLDTEHTLPDGGIPYNQAKDPTEYPSTTNRTSPSTGYFAAPGNAATKFYQTWSSRNTYSDFIRNYI